MAPVRFTLCLAFAVSPAAGQSSARDSTPFRPGQWAAQFGAGASFASLGFVRFSTPTRAWVLDFRLNGGHSHNRSYRSDTLVEDSYNSSAVVSARIGRRFYQGRGKAVATFQSVGVLGGVSHACGGNLFAPSFCDNGWNAGAFAELGGVYLVSPRLSLGGTAAASFTYERSKGGDNVGDRGTHWGYSGAFQGLSFAATVYF